MIEREIQGGMAIVGCLPIDGDGLIIESPADTVIESSSLSATIDGFQVSFTEEGEHSVKCSSDSLGIQGSAKLTVVTDAVDKQYIGVGKKLGSLHFALSHLPKAIENEDNATITSTIDQLKELVAGCEPEYVAEADFLIPYPGGWPSVEELQEGGIVAGPDDEAFAASLDQIAAKLDEIQAALGALELDPTDDNLNAALEKMAEIEALEQAFTQLEPSQLAVVEHQGKLALVTGVKMETAVKQLASTIVTIDKDRFSLIGCMASVAIQGVLSTLPSFTGILTKAAKVISMMVAMLIVKDYIAENVQGGGVSVVGIFTNSAPDFLYPGMPWKAMGSGFSKDPKMTKFIFIAPAFGQALTDPFWDIVDLLGKIKGLVGEGNLLSFIQKCKELMDQLQKISDDIDKVVGWDHLALTPNSVEDIGDGTQWLHFPPCPKNVNPSWIQAPGILIPTSLITGSGDSIDVLVNSG